MNEHGERLHHDGITSFPWVYNKCGFAGHFVTKESIKKGRYPESLLGRFVACETYFNGSPIPSFRLNGLTLAEVTRAIEE